MPENAHAKCPETPPEETFDRVEDGGQCVVVRRRGAEMVSWRADGKGVLHRDGETGPPASGWANHATVMGYFLHRLLGEKSLYRGRPVAGGNHGFLRNFEFAAPRHVAGGLVYEVPASRVPPAAYPLPVGMELAYFFRRGWLEVRFCFSNQSGEEAKLSFGLHPGFAVPADGSWSLEFPTGRYVRHMAPGNFLDGRTEALDFGGGTCPYSRDGLPDSYLLELAGVPDPVFELDAGTHRVVLDFHGVPYLTLWSDGGPFVCIEPCWGLPDNNPQKPFEEKEGIQSIPAGGTLEASFRMKILP